MTFRSMRLRYALDVVRTSLVPTVKLALVSFSTEVRNVTSNTYKEKDQRGRGNENSKADMYTYRHSVQACYCFNGFNLLAHRYDVPISVASEMTSHKEHQHNGAPHHLHY
jgi:hypothetical protein